MSLKKCHLTIPCFPFRLFFLFFVCLLSLSTIVCPVFGETGVRDNEILIGQSSALTGSTQALGIGMRDGAMAYFKYINSTGGIRGKKIRLISLDDGYKPDVCLANTKQLVDLDEVFLLFGYVGTPTAKEAVPFILERKIPFFAPFSGAEFLRNPVSPYIFNIRNSYFQETEAMIDRLFVDRDIKRIAVFYQNDSYGMAGLEGVRRALKKRDREILVEGHYARNEMDVEFSVEVMLKTKPDAVIMIGVYRPCAKFIEMMRNNGSEALFLNVSFVGGDALGSLLGNIGLGVVVTQTVPFPHYKRIPIVSEYNDILKKFLVKSEPNFTSMEGFIAAKALCKILKETPDPITREGFIETADKQNDIDLGGFPFSFSPDNHQGSDIVYFSQIGPGGFLSPIRKLSDLYEYKR